MIEWRQHYPHSIRGKLRTLWHNIVLGHDCRRGPSGSSRFVTYDDTCRVAWWA